MALNIKVGPIGALDMLKFKNQVKKRNQIIDSTTPAPRPGADGTAARARGRAGKRGAAASAGCEELPAGQRRRRAYGLFPGGAIPLRASLHWRFGNHPALFHQLRPAACPARQLLDNSQTHISRVCKRLYTGELAGRNCRKCIRPGRRILL